MSDSVATRRTQDDPIAPIAPVPPGLRTLLAPFWLAMIVIGCAWFVVDERGFWFLAGACCCLVVSIPAMIRGYDLLSPWTVVLLAVYISTGFRGLFISLEFEGSRSIDDLFLLGRSAPYYFRPALLFVFALGTMVTGYLLSGRVRRKTSPLGEAAAGFHSGRVTIAVIVCAGVGLAALLQFVASTGGFSLSSLSAKRTTINGLDLSSTYQSSGQWRILNQFAPIALWVQLAHYAKQGRRLGILSHRSIWVGLLFLNAIALPVYASSRADIVYIVLGALVVQLALRPGSISVRPLLAGLAVVLILVSALTTARSSTNAGSTQGTAVNSQAIIDAFVLSRTFTDIASSGNIINSVPQSLPYAKGETIAAWAVAPIPRSLWPDKPIVSSGPTIGILIYGNERSGVPPGMIAESYWNFGFGGIVVLPMLCGVFLRVIGEWWRPRAKTDPGAAVLMAGVAMPNGVYFMTNSIGSAPFQALVALVLLVPVVAFIRDHSARASATSRRTGARQSPLTGASGRVQSLPR